MSLRQSAIKFLQGFVRNKTKHKKQGLISNRSRVGLYAGKDIRFGNSISFSHKKTRRTWKPNVQKKALWSETLDRWIRFHITTHALRCVDLAGGIDNYLLKTRDDVLNSKEGLRAKKEILHVMKTTPKAKRRDIRAEEAPAENDSTEEELAEDDVADETVAIDTEAAAKLAGDRQVKDTS